MAVEPCFHHQSFTASIKSVFIIAALQARGIPVNWQHWITNSFLNGCSQVIINGILGNQIILKRGVR
jgi:hypothetical protein